MSMEDSNLRKRRKLEPLLDPRFLSDATYNEFRESDARKKGLYKGPKIETPYTEFESKVAVQRINALPKKDRANPLKNVELFPEKEIIDEF
jgi:hypothetical protein